ncbi:MAG: hypothetical protein EZS28_036909, partial [Streblomastix strix]
MIKRINIERQIDKDKNGKWSFVSANDILLTKFICSLLNHIITYIPAAAAEVKTIGTPFDLLLFIQSIAVQCISKSHTQFLLTLLVSAKDKLKKELQQRGAVLILAQILKHTNTDVKRDTIITIRHLLILKKSEGEKGQQHPLYQMMKASGCLSHIFSTCFIEKQINNEIKLNAAMVLGFLNQEQEMEARMRHAVLDQLKQGLYSQNEELNCMILRIIYGLIANF